MIRSLIYDRYNNNNNPRYRNDNGLSYKVKVINKKKY